MQDLPFCIRFSNRLDRSLKFFDSRSREWLGATMALWKMPSKARRVQMTLASTVDIRVAFRWRPKNFLSEVVSALCAFIQGGTDSPRKLSSPRATTSRMSSVRRRCSLASSLSPVVLKGSTSDTREEDTLAYNRAWSPTSVVSDANTRHYRGIAAREDQLEKESKRSKRSMTKFSLRF